jgi:predicted ATPase
VSGRVPTSVRALIAARLDLLAPEAKRVAQAAATVGDVFWDEALGGLLGGDVSVTVGSELRALRRRGLVDEEPASSFTGSRQFRFHHALIREVAYESLAKVERAHLHRLAGRWLEERADTRPELRGAIAHHFDSALALEAEVAPLEPPEPALVETTVASLLAAGEWATANAALLSAAAKCRAAAGTRRVHFGTHGHSRARATSAGRRRLRRHPFAFVQRRFDPGRGPGLFALAARI